MTGAELRRSVDHGQTEMKTGDRLGPYEVTAKIGEGGMGEVYRARDTKLDLDVALKVLRCADGSLYTGIAKDVDRRVEQHNTGTASRYTRSRLPVTLIYQEEPTTKGAALKREMAVKALSRKAKEALVEARLEVSDETDHTRPDYGKSLVAFGPFARTRDLALTELTQDRLVTCVGFKAVPDSEWNTAHHVQVLRSGRWNETPACRQRGRDEH